MGALGTAVHYLILVLMVQVFMQTPVLSTSLGFVAGAITNYLLNYHVTFLSNKSHRETMTKFFLVAGFGGVLNGLIMHIGVNGLLLHYFFMQVIATVVVLLVNFSINRFWTFAPSENTVNSNDEIA